MLLEEKDGVGLKACGSQAAALSSSTEGEAAIPPAGSSGCKIKLILSYLKGVCMLSSWGYMGVVMSFVKAFRALSAHTSVTY